MKHKTHLTNTNPVQSVLVTTEPIILQNAHVVAWKKYCKTIYRKNYYVKNKEKIAIYRKKYWVKNKKHLHKKAAEYRQQNKDKLREKNRLYRKNNPDKVKKYNLNHYSRNREHIINKSKEYYKHNREKIIAYVVQHRRENQNTHKKWLLGDSPKAVNNRLASRLRNRIGAALGGNSKSSTTLSLLGCSIPELRTHLESKFVSGMTWENRGKYGWHIDHIKPCASFNLSDPEQQKECFHYTNLQPLWAKDNLQKSASVGQQK